MDNEWKDNSTIYMRQHSHYYRWILYPVIILFLGVLIFLFLGSSEQVVRSSAQISSDNIRHIQIPIEASIQENNLKENLEVRKGDTLVVFNVDNLTKQKEQLASEITTVEEKNKNISLLIRSLEEEVNLFTQNDVFGYSNQVNAFLKGKEQTTQATQQIEETYQNNVQNIQRTKNQLAEQIEKNQSKLQELEQIRTAWINQQNIQNYSTEYTSQYDLWQLQMRQSQETEKEQVKATILMEIDQSISQLQQTIDQLQLQKETIDTPVAPTGEVNSQLATIGQTKEQQIAVAKEQQKELLAEKEKNEVTLKSIENELKNGTIVAPMDGTIHLNSSYEKVGNIAKGTVIADIFDKRNKGILTIISRIPSDEMTHIKVGMPIHMKLDKKGVSEKVLNGEITEISETSTTTEEGTFFVVKGKIDVSKKNSLRYGLTGEIFFVIGKKTYINQIIDFMFDND